MNLFAYKLREKGWKEIFRDGVERERRCGVKGISRNMTEIFAFFVGPSILFGFIYFQLFTSGQGGVGPGQ